MLKRSPLKLRDYITISWRGLFHTSALLSGLIFFNTSIATIQNVAGNSMSPTLSPEYDSTGEEDTILVSKFRRGNRYFDEGSDEHGEHFGVLGDDPRRFPLEKWNIQRLHRGDIITFWSPETGQIGLKRVIALGGDLVQPEKRVKHGRGYRLPQKGEVVDSLYKIPESLRVPYGHLWVEGDDPGSSLDSRDYGPISQALVESKVMRVVWPWRRTGANFGERPMRETSTKVTPGISLLPPEFEDHTPRMRR